MVVKEGTRVNSTKRRNHAATLKLHCSRQFATLDEKFFMVNFENLTILKAVKSPQVLDTFSRCWGRWWVLMCRLRFGLVTTTAHVCAYSNPKTQQVVTQEFDTTVSSNLEIT